jgi:hypothetical protein
MSGFGSSAYFPGSSGGDWLYRLDTCLLAKRF